MRWTDINWRICSRFNPSEKNATARKHERVRTLPIDYGKFKLPVERRRRYRLPAI